MELAGREVGLTSLHTLMECLLVMRIELHRVRVLREQRGLSQATLATAVGLSRQSLGAIESGRAVPSVDVALRIARTLEATVEELFAQEDASAALEVESADALAPGERVALAHLDGRWVAHRIGAAGGRLTADGIVREGGPGPLSAEPIRRPDEAVDNLVIMGCATGLGLLADRLNTRRGGGRFVWLPSSSTAALEALARRRTHLGGVHLVDGRSREANVGAVRRIACADRGAHEPVVLITLARWEAGLVVRADEPRVRGPDDLARPGLRLATREAGSGARDLLDRALRRAGARRAAVALQANGHLEVAAAVAMGAADTGVATRDAAIMHGLRLLPLAEERYDLVIPRSLVDEPRVARLLDMLVSIGFRRELATLGYDVTPTGERIAEVGAA